MDSSRFSVLQQGKQYRCQEKETIAKAMISAMENMFQGANLGALVTILGEMSVKQTLCLSPPTPPGVTTGEFSGYSE